MLCAGDRGEQQSANFYNTWSRSFQYTWGIHQFFLHRVLEFVQLPSFRPAIFSKGIIDNRTIVLHVTSEIQPSQLQASFSQNADSEQERTAAGFDVGG